MSIDTLISQMPNFAGLLICTVFLWRIVQAQAKQIDYLVQVIVRKENCEDGEETVRMQETPPRPYPAKPD